MVTNDSLASEELLSCKTELSRKMALRGVDIGEDVSERQTFIQEPREICVFS